MGSVWGSNKREKVVKISGWKDGRGLKPVLSKFQVKIGDVKKMI